MPQPCHHFGQEWLARGQEPARVTTRGGITCTSGIPGIDLVTGLAADNPAEQFHVACHNLVQLLEDAGQSLATIALIEVTIPERSLRQHIDGPWLELYPEESDRPARKTNQRALPAGLFVQINAICFDAPRRPIEIDGLKHRAPIPMGLLADPYVVSSVIGGEDPATGEASPDPVAQIRQAFANCTHLMNAAGADEQAINHLWVFLPDDTHAAAMLETFLQLFPDPASRPARKTLICDLPEGCAIQLQISGCASGRRANFEVAGFQHHDPIPLASLAGNLFQSSGIHGQTPGTLEIAPGGTMHQLGLSLKTVEQLLRNAGGSQSDIAALTVLLKDFGDAAEVHQQIARQWGEQAMPAIRFAQVGLPPNMDLQLHVTGWLG